MTARFHPGWLFLVALLAAPAARAIELGDGLLHINGYGGWGAGVTFGGHNRYLVGSPEGSYDHVDMALQVIAQPHDQLRLGLELFGEFEAGQFLLEVDWAFAEWRFLDAFALRAGKIMNPVGISGEVQDVGTLRPFFSLPQSVYGPNGLAGEAFIGLEAVGTFQAAQAPWSLGYQAYAGLLEAKFAASFRAAQAGYTPTPGAAAEGETAPGRYLAGGRLIFSPGPSGLSFRVSGFRVSLVDPARALGVVGLSAEYATERFLARLEAFVHGLFGEASNLSGYLEVAYRPWEHWQVAARAETSQELGHHGVVTSLARHQEFAAGINYWFTPGLVAKLSYHLVLGNRFAFPELLDDALLQGPLTPVTHLVMLGSQFSF